MSELESLKAELNSLLELQKQAIIDKEQLEQESQVQKYMKLSSEIPKRDEKIKNLEIKVEIEKMKNCKHFLVTSLIVKEFDGHRTDTYPYCSCIKCGVNEIYCNLERRFDNELVRQKGKNYLKTKHNAVNYNEEYPWCDDNLAQAIYQKIITSNPDITEEEATEYWKASLHNIRTRKVSEQVEKSRVKRLGLMPGFANWKANDIIVR